MQGNLCDGTYCIVERRFGASFCIGESVGKKLLDIHSLLLGGACTLQTDS